jgi:hypothetical protein
MDAIYTNFIALLYFKETMSQQITVKLGLALTYQQHPVGSVMAVSASVTSDKTIIVKYDTI